MLQQLFGTELSSPMRIIIAIIIIAVLLGITFLLFRKLNGGARGAVARGRQGPRLAVLDTVPVDQKRRLVLVRRDATEHLLLIGGSNDVVIESQIAAQQDDEPVREALPPQRGPRRVAATASPAVLTGGAVVEALAAPVEAALPPATPDPVPAPAPEPEIERAPRRRLPLRAEAAPVGRERPLAAAPRVPTPEIPAPEPVIEEVPAAELAMPAPRREAAAVAEDVEAFAESLQGAPDIIAESSTGRTDPGLDDMARRLDAVLTPPAVAAAEPEAGLPKLDLADLLSEPSEGPVPDLADLDLGARPGRIGTPRPAAERPAPSVMPERLVGRLARGPRPQPPRAAPEFRPRAEPPRIEAGRAERGAPPAITAPPRTVTPGREPPMRLREFSLRPPAPTSPAPPREPAVELRAPAEPVPEMPPIALSPPEVAAEPVRPAAAPEVSPVVTPPANDSAPAAEAAPAPEKPEAKPSDDFAVALDEFDSEMANLLGRTSSRN